MRILINMALVTQIVLLLVFTVAISWAKSVELTFELPDNAKQCFHEEIGKDVKSTIEFQVS